MWNLANALHCVTSTHKANKLPLYSKHWEKFINRKTIFFSLCNCMRMWTRGLSTTGRTLKKDVVSTVFVPMTDRERGLQWKLGKAILKLSLLWSSTSRSGRDMEIILEDCYAQSRVRFPSRNPFFPDFTNRPFNLFKSIPLSATSPPGPLLPLHP